MNVDFRWLGTSVVRVRVLAAGLVLLVAGCAVLGSGSRSRHASANAAAPAPALTSLAALDAQLAPSPVSLASPSARSDAQARARSLFAGLPMIFEPNQGQANLDPSDSRARFLSRGAGYSLFLGNQGAILSLISQNSAHASKSKKRDLSVSSLEMKLAGANANPAVSGDQLLPGKSNYFLGSDPAKWHSGVPQYARVRYENVYPGVNLEFYGNQGRLEYDFQVAPGADAQQAELQFNGADQLQLKDGNLLVAGKGANLRLDAPRVYQEISGRQQPVEGKFILRADNRVGFAIGSYDHSRELIIDPVIEFSTYFGGTGDERATSIAIDPAFNVYLTGSTSSPNLPTVAGVVQTALAAGATQNIYIAKITPPLGSIAALLDYVTYLGGDGIDTPAGIAVDANANPYVAGTTSSTNFPTSATNAYQTTPEVPGTHVFVTQLNSSATQLLYSSYLSGNGTDLATGMTIDPSGFIYITGTTTSTDTSSGNDQFPASGLPQGVPLQSYSRSPGNPEFFVTKIYPNAPRIQSIAYSTYFGGSNFETTAPVATGGGIAVDNNGNVYFTGTTNYTYAGCVGCGNSDFPILNAYQPCLDQTPPSVIVNPPSCTPTSADTESDAFVAKLNLNPTAAQGQQLVFSTYVGGSVTDSGVGIAINTGASNVYIVGTTNSPDIGSGTNTFNTSAAYQRCLDLAVNPALGTLCPTPAGTANDAFVAVLTNPSITTGTTQTNVALTYFSYLGGANNETGTAIAVDATNGAVITGSTQSTDFPVNPPSNPIQSTLTGAQDAFMARLNTTAVVGQNTVSSWSNPFGGAATDPNTVFTEGTGVAIDSNQNAYFAGDTNSQTLQVNKPYQTSNGGGYDSFVTQLAPKFSVSVTGILSQGTNQQFISAGNPATFTYTITNNGPDPASQLSFTDNLAVTNVKVALVSANVSPSSQTCATGSTSTSISCSLPSLQVGSTAQVTVVVTPQANPQGGQAPFNGGEVEILAPGNIVLANALVQATMSDFTVAVSPASNSVPAAGDTAVYQVALSPNPLYASSISLSCTQVPPASACNFTNSPVTLLGPGASTLNITTTARPVVTTSTARPLRLYGFWLALPGLTLLGVGVGGKRRRARIVGIGMLCFVFALILLQPACSHSSTQAPTSGTPAGIYNITVQATSGSDTKSQSITLQVP